MSVTAVTAQKISVVPMKASERIKRLSNTPVYVKALIYGDAGAGKTWCACTAPNPLLVLSEWAVARPTLERLRIELGIDPDVITVENDKEAEEAYKYAMANSDKYDSLVLDGITDLNMRIMREVLSEATLAKMGHDPDILEQRDWNKVVQRTTYILMLYRDFPGHTIITALATEDNMKTVPNVAPKSVRRAIASQFNMVGWLTTETRQGKANTRILYTDLSPSYIAKSPGNFIPATIENPNMTAIIDLLTKHEEQKASGSQR